MKTHLFHWPIRACTQSSALRVSTGPVRWGLAGALAAVALLAVSCGKKSDPQVLARVGFSEIRVEQFQQQMSRRGGTRPDKLDKEALLQEMIEQEALYVRAINAGLDKDPDVQRAWRNLLIGKLKEHELATRIEKTEVTQAELEAAYAAGRDRFTRPAAVRLAVLYLKTDSVTKPGKIAELQRRMTEARQKALAPEAAGGPGFGALAISSSEDQATRYNGGIVGWVEQDRGHAWLGTAPIEAGFALRNPGDVSEVITDAKGVYLVKLLERREPALVPLGEVESSLRQRLLVEKRHQTEQAFIRESRAAIPVQTHPELLARVPLPIPPAVAENKQPPAFP